MNEFQTQFLTIYGAVVLLILVFTALPGIMMVLVAMDPGRAGVTKADPRLPQWFSPVTRVICVYGAVLCFYFAYSYISGMTITFH